LGVRAVLGSLAVAGLLACAGQDGPAVVADEGQSPAADLGESQLPTGHPSVATVDPAANLPAVPAGAGSGASAITWEVPQGWLTETPTSSMRRAQYRIAGSAGDAERVVFYFGPGQGGNAEENALRWADQFGQPDGTSSRDVLETRELVVAGMTVTLAEVSGIYSGGMAIGRGEPKSLANAMLLGAIVEGPDASWFFKMTGPRSTVEAQREGFETMIRSLRKGDAA